MAHEKDILFFPNSQDKTLRGKQWWQTVKMCMNTCIWGLKSGRPFFSKSVLYSKFLFLLLKATLML